MFIGYSSSDDYDVTNNKGNSDAWLVKIKENGDIEKQTNFGGSLDDFGVQLIEIDNNYIISVGSFSADKDFAQKGRWIIKCNEGGNIVWKKHFNDLNGGAIGSTKNGDILVANCSATDFILYKLDGNGNIKVNKNINFTNQNKKQPSANKIIESKDNGLIIIGDLGGGNNQDAVLFRTDSKFNYVEAKFINGNNYDKSASIIQTGNGSYIYQIATSSTNLDLKIESDPLIASMIISIIED